MLRLRLPLLLVGLLLVSAGRWLSSSTPGWSWTDWLALAIVILATWWVTTALAPSSYLVLTMLPQPARTAEERHYTRRIKARLWWVGILVFWVLYAAAFVVRE